VARKEGRERGKVRLLSLLPGSLKTDASKPKEREGPVRKKEGASQGTKVRKDLPEKRTVAGRDVQRRDSKERENPLREGGALLRR